jgi:transcriptional regulator with XRE-family HTH domain
MEWLEETIEYAGSSRYDKRHRWNSLCLSGWLPKILREKATLFVVAWERVLVALGWTMPKTKPWNQIRRSLSPEREQELRTEIEREVARMKLPDLRRARRLSQETLAELLGMNQGDVSRLERRADMYVRSLRRYVEAAGGKMWIIAEFPDVEPIELEMFGEIYAPTDAERDELLKEHVTDHRHAQKKRLVSA